MERLGLIEKIIIEGKEIFAKVDTGASTSSIDEKLAEELGITNIIKTKHVRNAHGESERPVVKAKVIVQGKQMKTRFNIMNRKRMKYKVLLGKNTLKRGFIIDPNK